MNVAVRKLFSDQADFQTALTGLLNRDESADSGVEQIVADIITDVRKNGDDALYRYTRKFEGFDAEARGLEVPEFRLQQALKDIPAKQLGSLKYAVERVRSYHEKQLQESWNYTEEDGTTLGQKVTPMKRVGLYVPGGKATYPSSVIMNAVPAKVAGVQELIMVSPTPKGEFNDMVLAAAVLSGSTRSIVSVVHRPLLRWPMELTLCRRSIRLPGQVTSLWQLLKSRCSARSVSI